MKKLSFVLMLIGIGLIIFGTEEIRYKNHTPYRYGDGEIAWKEATSTKTYAVGKQDYLVFTYKLAPQGCSIKIPINPPGTTTIKGDCGNYIKYEK